MTRMDLIGVPEVAGILGVSRQRADELSRRRDFPEPYAIIGARTRAWKRTDVEAWAKANGRMK